MRLKWQEIAEATGGQILRGLPEKEVQGYAQDSRLVQPGDLFFPIIGPNRDGHDFLEDVAAKGCRSFLISHPEALERLEKAAAADADHQGDELAVILVPDTEKALEDLARYALARIGCRIIGVTFAMRSSLIVIAIRRYLKIGKNQEFRNISSFHFCYFFMKRGLNSYFCVRDPEAAALCIAPLT